VMITEKHKQGTCEADSKDAQSRGGVTRSVRQAAASIMRVKVPPVLG
jgi:hypothetical protein